MFWICVQELVNFALVIGLCLNFEIKCIKENSVLKQILTYFKTYSVSIYITVIESVGNLALLASLI